MAPVGTPGEREIVTRIPRAAPITHANNSLWQPGAKSFFRDPRASNVGDIITVNITVSDAAKLSNSTARSRANSDSADLTNFFGLETVLPTGMTPGSLVNLGSDTSNTGNGSIDRSESISLTLAALVAQVLPNGNFVIDGRQQVRVNNEMRDLKVSGIVRAEDITQDNTVNLAQIAEARISYGGVGTVSDVQQPRYGSQLYDILMPW
jgi:flagellar L-ring protein precursor FlgH